jgi:hypothetical protein
MTIIRLFALFAAAPAIVICALGCSSTTRVTVPVPPRVDLAQFHSIGLVTFTGTEADPQIRKACTQQFLQALQDAQPGTRIIELGEEGRVLASVDRQKWDARTLSAVQMEYGVDVVILGQFNVERVKPNVQLSTEWKSLSIKSDVNGALAARLLETATGATMWTDSARMTTTVAGGHVNSRGGGSFGTSDTDAAYREMVGCLVHDITDDFRTHYITKRVPKDQLQTASAEGPAVQ